MKKLMPLQKRAAMTIMGLRGNAVAQPAGDGRGEHVGDHRTRR